ncbi:SCP-like protein [Ancylostoma ceylanicum]|uniref:SCP-like protein n=1 Tax=Ancylostoma ceylanicum TaxID=53326 RepID=A0A0D6LPK2_9BILA|nr:SCP-like protein [Ancylostoma ceylanicum]
MPTGCCLTVSYRAKVAIPTPTSRPSHRRHQECKEDTRIDKQDGPKNPETKGKHRGVFANTSVLLRLTKYYELCGTGRDSKCCDREKSCADWASWGECENRPSFMLRKCKLSCNACRPTLPKASGLERCRDNGMTREVRQKLLDMHNKYRMMVAKGQAKDKAGGNAPMAARMLKMEYDCDIEENAMRHAVGCAWGHSAQHERENLGENLYYSTNPRMNHVKAAEDACKLWFDELATRGVGQEDNILTDEVWNKPGQIGHYTQMVWQDSYKLGCYVNSCPSMTYVVCQYGPQGNWIDDPIYETGSPCTTDDDCMCSNCKCSRSEGLCIVQ